MAAHGIGAIDLVVVNLYPFAADRGEGRGARRDHREYRHRRPLDGPLGRQEPRLSSRSSPIPADYAELIAALDASGGMTSLDLRKRLAAKAFAATAAYDAAIAGWFAHRRSGRAFPETRVALPMIKHGASCAMARIRTRSRRSTAQAGARRERHRPGAPGAGQGAELQQLQRRRRRAGAGRRVPRRPRRPASSSSTPIPAASPPRRRCAEAYRGRVRLRHGLGLRRHHRGQPAARRRRPPRRSPASSPRSSSRPTPTRRRAAVFARKKNLRLLLTGELPDPARRRADDEVDRRRLPGPVARQWPDRPRRPQGRDEARADRAGAGRLPVRLDGRQACEVQRHRLRQGRRHRRHRRRADEPAGIRPHRRLEGEGRGGEGRLGRSRARSARRSRRTPSSPSPTACWPRPRRARRR